jgi:hypothetical protein
MNTTSSTNLPIQSFINDSKLAQFNLFFEYDNSLSDVRKDTRNRAIR